MRGLHDNPEEASNVAADQSYRHKLEQEAQYWTLTELDYERQESLIPHSLQRFVNARLTGDPDLHWFDDLRGRGPFRAAAELGSSSGWLERRWLEQGSSETLDVYELSAGVLEKARVRLDDAGLLSRVRLIRADLNLAELPERRYDVVWCAGVLHHLLSLEHVFDQISRALRPGGLFAFYEYVGEKRLQFDPERLRLCEEALASVPDVYWRNGRRVRNAELETISPFEAVRSDEIPALASSRFRTLHWARAGVLAGAAFGAVDFLALARQMPDAFERFLAAERTSEASNLDGSVAYAVFQRAE